MKCLEYCNYRFESKIPSPDSSQSPGFEISFVIFINFFESEEELKRPVRTRLSWLPHDFAVSTLPMSASSASWLIQRVTFRALLRFVSGRMLEGAGDALERRKWTHLQAGNTPNILEVLKTWPISSGYSGFRTFVFDARRSKLVTQKIASRCAADFSCVERRLLIVFDFWLRWLTQLKVLLPCTHFSHDFETTSIHSYYTCVHYNCLQGKQEQWRAWELNVCFNLVRCILIQNLALPSVNNSKSSTSMHVLYAEFFLFLYLLYVTFSFLLLQKRRCWKIVLAKHLLFTWSRIYPNKQKLSN